MLLNGGRNLPSWLMPTVDVTKSPVIVIFAVRASMVVFVATEYVMVPLPTPLVALVIVTHGGLLEAVQLHAPESTMVTLLEPPLAPNPVAVGVRIKALQGGTVKVATWFPGSVLKSTASAEPKLP